MPAISGMIGIKSVGRQNLTMASLVHEWGRQFEANDREEASQVLGRFYISRGLSPFQLRIPKFSMISTRENFETHQIQKQAHSICYSILSDHQSALYCITPRVSITPVFYPFLETPLLSHIRQIQQSVNCHFFDPTKYLDNQD